MTALFSAKVPAAGEVQILYPEAMGRLDSRTFELVMHELRSLPKKLVYAPAHLPGSEFQDLLFTDFPKTPLGPEVKLEPKWNGTIAEGRFGEIPLAVQIWRGCLDGDCGSDLSREFPAFNRIAPDGKTHQVFMHKSIPFAIYDIVLFHELVEAELYTYYGVPLEVAHTVAVRKTNDYVKRHCDPELQIRYAEFEGRTAAGKAA